MTDQTKSLARVSLKLLKLIMFAVLLHSCSDDTPPPPEPELEAQDFLTYITENMPVGHEIGKMTARTNQGELIFRLVSQVPQGGIHLDPESGIITIADASVFDYEKNGSISAKVEVSNGTLTREVIISIIIGDVVEQMDFKILMMKTERYDEDGQVIAWQDDRYEAGKIRYRYVYVKEPREYYSDFYYYNDQGLLDQIERHETEGVTYNRFFHYDNEFRLTSIDHLFNNEMVDWKDNFDYVSDNEVLLVSTYANGESRYQKFGLSEGLVIAQGKLTDDPIYAAQYEGRDVVWRREYEMTYDYTYNEVGINPMRDYTKMMGKKLANVIFNEGTLDVSSELLAERLIDKVEVRGYDDYKLQYAYLLDEYNLPLEEKIYLVQSNGASRLYQLTTYEYTRW